MTYKDDWNAGRISPDIPPQQMPRHRGAPPSQPKRKRKIWPWIVIAMAVLLFGACAAIISSATPDNSPAISPVPSQAVVSPSAENSVTTTPAIAEAEAAPGTSFENGEWLVGKTKEVEPGIYRSAGPHDGPVKLCYVDTKSADGSDTIIAQGVSNDGPVRITVREGQVVKAQGCKTFQKVG